MDRGRGGEVKQAGAGNLGQRPQTQSQQPVEPWPPAIAQAAKHRQNRVRASVSVASGKQVDTGNRAGGCRVDDSDALGVFGRNAVEQITDRIPLGIAEEAAESGLNISQDSRTATADLPEPVGPKSATP